MHNGREAVHDQRCPAVARRERSLVGGRRSSELHAFSIVTGIIGTATVIGAFLTGLAVDHRRDPQLREAQRRANSWQVALPLADSHLLVRPALGRPVPGCF
jgi:hypothetical protein